MFLAHSTLSALFDRLDTKWQKQLARQSSEFQCSALALKEDLPFFCARYSLDLPRVNDLLDEFQAAEDPNKPINIKNIFTEAFDRIQQETSVPIPTTDRDAPLSIASALGISPRNIPNEFTNSQIMEWLKKIDSTARTEKEEKEKIPKIFRIFFRKKNRRIDEIIKQSELSCAKLREYQKTLTEITIPEAEKELTRKIKSDLNKLIELKKINQSNNEIEQGKTRHIVDNILHISSTLLRNKPTEASYLNIDLPRETMLYLMRGNKGPWKEETKQVIDHSVEKICRAISSTTKNKAEQERMTAKHEGRAAIASRWGMTQRKIEGILENRFDPFDKTRHIRRLDIVDPKTGEVQRRESLEICFSSPNNPSREAIRSLLFWHPDQKMLGIVEVKTDNDWRNKGLFTQFFSNILDLTKKIGANEIKLLAGESHGPVAWAQTGAVVDEDDTLVSCGLWGSESECYSGRKGLHRRIKFRFEHQKEVVAIPEDDAKDILKIMRPENPYGLLEMSTRYPQHVSAVLGRLDTFCGESPKYACHFNLQDPKQMKVVNARLRKRRGKINYPSWREPPSVPPTPRMPEKTLTL